MRMGLVVVVLALGMLPACKKGDTAGAGFQTVGRQPDVPPVMLNKELPFRYPPALYAQKVQGNVTLRIFIDKNGQIVADSTRVAETSGFNALDSAAMKGSRDLRFEPAKTLGLPVPVSILLPVFFRHPDAPPLPGDSLIRKDSSTSTSTATASSTAQTADTVKRDTAKTVAATPKKTTPPKKPVRRTTTRRKR